MVSPLLLSFLFLFFLVPGLVDHKPFANATKAIETTSFPDMMQKRAADTKELVKAIDDAVAGTGYGCKPVSWEDSSRGTVGGKVSCWGGNIADVRIWNRDGSPIYTLRSSNFDEKLCGVDPSNIAVVVGNQKVPWKDDGAVHLESVTLKWYLENIDRVQKYGEYAGIDKQSGRSFLDSPLPNNEVTVRFQAVFLPIGDRGETPNFCTDVYNYQAYDDENPRNLILLSTPQGTSVQQDGEGAKKLFFHDVGKDGKIHRYWLEAEGSSHKVGGGQVETLAEKQDALSRGKATAMHIGIPAMAQRFNVQMMIQVPIEQKKREASRGIFESMSMGLVQFSPSVPMSLTDSDSETMSLDDGPLTSVPESYFGGLPTFSFGGGGVTRGGGTRGIAKSASGVSFGESNAARVSRGKHHDIWSGLAVKDVERDPKQPITITVTMYYTVTGGIPTAADVKAGIADLEALYEAAGTGSFDLSSAPEGVTQPLTHDDTNGIAKKVAKQPYEPPPFRVSDASPFSP